MKWLKETFTIFVHTDLPLTEELKAFSEGEKSAEALERSTSHQQD